MEIYQRYVAKDGRTFDDALECQEYEKTLGVVSGSVGDFINMLEKNTKRETYIFGVVKVRDGNTNSLYIRATMPVDDMLEDFVNVEELTEEQRYKVATAGELADTLRKLNQDLPCACFIVFSDNINLGNAGCMECHNQMAWDEEPSKQLKR